jgi:hypothetical protein
MKITSSPNNFLAAGHLSGHSPVGLSETKIQTTQILVRCSLEAGEKLRTRPHRLVIKDIAGDKKTSLAIKNIAGDKRTSLAIKNIAGDKEHRWR